MRDEQSPLAEICELVKNDAALTGQLLHAANSAAYTGAKRVGSVQAAVGRLGLKELFRIVGCFTTAQLTEQVLEHHNLSTGRLRDNMIHTACLCEQLAAECGLDPRQAYTAGLLRPIGLFVCDRLADAFAPPPFRAESDGDFLTWEGRLFGIGHDEVGALVLEEWAFPEEIIEAVRRHLRPDNRDYGHRLASLLNLAGGRIAAQGRGLVGEAAHWVRPQERMDELGLTESRVLAAEVRAAEVLGGLHKRLLDNPAEEPRPAAVDSEKLSQPAEEKCDSPAPAGVVEANDASPVHTPPTAPAPVLDFTTFMRNYQNMVYSTAVRLTGNETQAEDIAQEVFIKAHEHYDTLRSSPTAGGWLKTVATNLSINHIQRYKKRWSFFTDLVRRDQDDGGERPVEFAAPDTFFQGVDSGERREWIERALARLPEHQRVPIVLYHFEDMPYDEIARKLRVSLSKVKTDIMRGREALAKILVHSGTAHETFST